MFYRVSTVKHYTIDTIASHFSHHQLTECQLKFFERLFRNFARRDIKSFGVLTTNQ